MKNGEMIFRKVGRLCGAGVIKDLANDTQTFNGKTVRIEYSIGNANNTNSSIDLFCRYCDPENLKIEYKSGTASIDADKIKTQFIERDLYNASNLNEIQWRMEGTGMTKDKLINWLNISQNRTAIENLGVEKIKSFFPNDLSINANNYVDKLILKFNESSVYQQVFK